ncbi:U3_small nucleolar RNA-associated protein 6 [Hexamita inflata]|uniref:Putative n=1 Tax=Hexamita inflata TaxID=28002 RepID=A0AA86NVS9_9EUKA|nr:U3 small nucleolar RNA-associated protein 6 [Hexamita inflata]CAI9969466.1 U3 small nucleolar RNA-associated protein 6 [Hexamita inflata]
MKAYTVDYYLEQYIPEYKSYLETNTFTETEIQKITRLREKLERSIQESFAPQLNCYADYLIHFKSTHQLATQRYRLNTNQQEIPPEFNITTKNYQRLFKLCVDTHKNNYKAYMFLVNFAIETKQEQLMNTITLTFQRNHPSYYLSWLLRAKIVEQQSSTTDARRIYSQSLQFIKTFTVEENKMHVTQLLNEDEKLVQKLPGDALKLFYNWTIMEINFINQLTKGIDNLDDIEDDGMKQLVNGGLVKYVVQKGIEFIIRFDVKGVISNIDLLKEIIQTNQYVIDFVKEIKLILEQSKLHMDQVIQQALNQLVIDFKFNEFTGQPVYYSKTNYVQLFGQIDQGYEINQQLIMDEGDEDLLGE